MAKKQQKVLEVQTTSTFESSYTVSLAELKDLIIRHTVPSELKRYASTEALQDAQNYQILVLDDRITEDFEGVEIRFSVDASTAETVKIQDEEAIDD